MQEGEGGSRGVQWVRGCWIQQIARVTEWGGRSSMGGKVRNISVQHNREKLFVQFQVILSDHAILSL